MNPSMMEKLWIVATSWSAVAAFSGRIWAIREPRVPMCLLDCFRDAIASQTTDSHRIQLGVLLGVD
jgi:hypothetical protein